MPEQVQRLITRVSEWWKKFSTKQKILLGSIVATILVALGILAFVVSRPSLVILTQCETTKEAGEVKQLLDDDGSIPYEMSQDGLTFYVDEKYEGTGAILLGTNGIPASGYSIENVFDSGFSATEADKTKRYKLYLEERFADHLEMLSNVENAYVTLDIPRDDGTVSAREEQSYASVILELSDEMSDDQAIGLAQYIATELGNDSTDNVLILDSDSNVLFSGGDSAGAMGTANTQLSYQTKMENLLKSEVKDVMVGSGLYDHVEVAPNLNMDFSDSRTVTRSYSAPDGMTQGMMSDQSVYESSAVGGQAQVPGTDTNDDTTYVMEDNNYTESNVTDTTTHYQNNEVVTDEKQGMGAIDYETSSIAVVARDYVIYDEDTLKDSGELDNMTFDEYVAANSEPTKLTVDPEYVTMIANATGFPEENISVIAYTEPVFEYSQGGRSIADYLQIILAVVILLLLGYVVFRSTRKEKEPEVEEELSVESLLETTKESQEDQLDDIGFNEKSEVRMLIEKFVEENPEAAASLLRNWLNEEWE